MRTINRKVLRASAQCLIVFLLLSFFSLPASAAIGQDSPQRFFIGAVAGFFYPQQNAFRQNYPKSIWPIELQLAWSLNRKLSVFGAARYLETSGSTVLLDVQRPGETYALNWRMATIRLGLNCQTWTSRFSPFLGTGISTNFYKEQWLEVPRLTEGKKTGFFVQAGIRYRLQHRWHALAQLEYSSVPAGSGAQGKANLGGLNLSLGLLAGIF